VRVPTPGESPHSHQISRRGLLALGGLTTVATAAGVAGTRALATSAKPTAAKVAAAQLKLDFENRSLGHPLTGYNGATIGRAYAHSGRYGCRLDPRTTSSGVASLEVAHTGFATNRPWAVFSMYFRLQSAPNTRDYYMNLFEIGNTSTAATKSQFTVFFRDGNLMCDFHSDETMAVASQSKMGNTWHHIEAKVSFGRTFYVAHVRYDDGQIVTLTSAPNKTPESVKTLWIHYPRKAVDYTMDVDDILMTTANTKPLWLT
jgi:hypothetical protein